MQQTTNYNLNKFDSTDKLENATRVGLNENADIIDEALSGLSEATGISYDNTDSGLTAETVQSAIDEIASTETAKTQLNMYGGKTITPYPYNAGELKSAQANKIKVIGFNKWDEEWENGTLDIATGNPTAKNTRVRSKNFIPVLPNTAYYFNYNGSNINTKGLLLCFYDESETFISGAWQTSANNPFAAPSGAKYVKFSAGDAYGGTYNHDICINISNPSLNGTYESYHADIKTVPAEVIALDGYGWSAGTVYNSVEWENGKAYFHKRVGSVDLGSLAWSYNSSDVYFYSNGIASLSAKTSNAICSNYVYAQSGDKTFMVNTNGNLIFRDSTYTSAAAFKTAMDGVMLYYELATEVVTEITSLFPSNFNLFSSAGDISFEFVDSSIAWVIPYEAESRIKADDVSYDNSVSGLSATNVQAALDEELGKIDILSTDYIVEDGTDGIWTYRKWNSGIAECWGVDVDTITGSANTSIGSGYQYYKDIAFPTNLFTDVPIATVNGRVATAYTWVTYVLPTTPQVQVYLYALTSGTKECYTYIHAIGTWK